MNLASNFSPTFCKKREGDLRTRLEIHENLRILAAGGIRDVQNAPTKKQSKTTHIMEAGSRDPSSFRAGHVHASVRRSSTMLGRFVISRITGERATPISAETKISILHSPPFGSANRASGDFSQVNRKPSPPQDGGIASLPIKWWIRTMTKLFENKLFSTKDIAAKLGLCTRSVSNLVKRHGIEPVLANRFSGERLNQMVADEAAYTKAKGEQATAKRKRANYASKCRSAQIQQQNQENNVKSC
jgi:hypothetical protein